MIQFSTNDTVQYFQDLGYVVLDENLESIYVGTRINIKDKDGYKFYISRHQIYGGIRNRNKVEYAPQKFAVQNPYTVENIQTWLNKSKLNFVFDHGKYLNNTEKNLFFKCNKCGELWNSSWGIVSRKIGCPYCGKKRISKGRSLADIRPDLIEEWDFDKNMGISPYSVLPRSSKSFWWKCKVCGNSWMTGVYQRNAKFGNKGTNCPKCCKSSGEIKIENILKKMNVEYVAQKVFSGCLYKASLYFDFYLPNHNCCIEYNGEHHYFPVPFSGNDEMAQKEFEKQKEKDSIKTEYCKTNNIKLITIPYWEYDVLEKYFDNLN